MRSSGFFEKSMPLGAALVCSVSLAYGSRMVLKPAAAIWSIMSV